MAFRFVCVLLPLLVSSCRQEVPEPTNTTTAQTAPQPQAQAAKPAATSSERHKTQKTQSPEPPELLLSEQERADGWIQLFDGRTLFGWKANNDVNWTVTDGVLWADAGPPGLLVTTVPFADYELRCDFRLENGGNSGVFLRTVFHPTDPAIDCYELNICDAHKTHPTGSFVKRKRTERDVVGEGAWKTFHVRVEGNRFVVKLDGDLIMDYVDESEQALRSGFIGLQKNAGKIEFRNVFLRPLGLESIFNGKDLSGWHDVPGSKSSFRVVDETIHVSNGPGFLETDATWKDFVLQFEARTNGDGLNSGVFFRTMRGTAEAPSNGYELQIQNGFRNGDRSDPVDSGTGAIFRRTKARWVIPDDHEWFAATLAASGDHFSVWINGLLVSDWTDHREPNENPRRGKRLAAGHISLQGHDPTTDLMFRRIRIAKSPSK